MNKKISFFEKDTLVYIVIFFISLALASAYQDAVQLKFTQVRLEIHRSILIGTSISPYRYRILVVMVLGWIINVLSKLMASESAFTLVYHLHMFCCLFFMLSGLYAFFNKFFEKKISFFGILYIAGTIPITFSHHYFQPWTFLEVVLYVCALRLIMAKKNVLLCPLIVIASLNKETAVLIPLTFLFTHFDRTQKNLLSGNKDTIRWFGLYVVLWGGVFVLVRYVCGVTTHEYTFSNNLSFNLQHWYPAIKNNFIFWGILGYFAVKGYKYAPRFIQKISLIFPLYLMLCLLFAYWLEVRVFIVMYPVCVPLALSYISHKYVL